MIVPPGLPPGCPPWFARPAARAWTCAPAPTAEARAFHARLPGYTPLFAEVDEQLADAGAAGPGLVAIPAGVGSLAQAGVTHYRSRPRSAATSLLTVEPGAAACVLASLVRGEPGTIATGETIMSGLNCGTPSMLAWPYLRDGLDAAVAVANGEAALAARDLAGYGIPAGPCGG